MPMKAITPPAAKILLAADFFSGSGATVGTGEASSSSSSVIGCATPGTSRKALAFRVPCIITLPVGVLGLGARSDVIKTELKGMFVAYSALPTPTSPR